MSIRFRPPFTLLVLLVAGSVAPAARAQQGAHFASPRPRLLVLTDIGGDPDDQQSLIRLLVHANEFEIEGLIASASGTPNELREKVTRPDLIRQHVAAYAQVHANLLQHDAAFPAAELLRERIRSGNPDRGWKAVGAGHSTAGSDWIVACLDRDDPRPLNVAIWGGQTDLAQALWQIRNDRGETGLVAALRKLRVYDIADQDGIAARMWREFPGLFYVLNAAKSGEDKRTAVFRGMYLRGDASLTSLDWVNAHVREQHGPLGALYPLKTWTAPNAHGVLKEGDTPSWFYFLPMGLGDPNHPEWLTWGGRFERNAQGIYRDAGIAGGEPADPRDGVAWFRPTFQNEFAARMDWCVKPYDEANHPPVVVINGKADPAPVVMHVTPGQRIQLTANGSSDPDGDALTYLWWIDGSSSAGQARLASERGQSAQDTCDVVIPDDIAAPSVHVVLEVTDEGAPRLTRYRRIVFDIR